MRRRRRKNQAISYELLVSTCELCRSTAYDLDLHHIKTRARGGDDTPGNLVGLCRSCHRWVHDHVVEATAKGYLVPSTHTQPKLGCAWCKRNPKGCRVCKTVLEQLESDM